MQNSRTLRLAFIAAIGAGLLSFLLLSFFAQVNAETSSIESLRDLFAEKPLMWGLIILPVMASIIAVLYNRNLQTISKTGQYFATLFQVSPIAIVSLDLEHKIITANPSFEKLFGYAEKEIIGQELDSLIASGDIESEAVELTSGVLAGHNVMAKGQRLRRDGRPVEVEIYGVPVIVDDVQVGALGLYHDVTERALARRELIKSEEKYRGIFENVIDFLYSHDLKGHIIDVNPAFVRSAEYDLDSLLQMSIEDLMPDDHKRFFPYYLSKVIKKGQSEGLLHVQSKSGRALIIEYKNSLIMNEDGPVGIRGSARDITVRIELEEKLKQYMHELDTLARTDALTGLYNRRGIYEQFEAEQKRALRERLPLAVALVDLDGLKQINDLYGHMVGDEALRIVAEGINKRIRSYDRVGRHGGDEFLVVLPGAVLDQAEKVCARIADTIAKTKTSKDGLSFSASIGVAEFFAKPENNETIDEALIRADDALYFAKQAGGGKVASYDIEAGKARMMSG